MIWLFVALFGAVTVFIWTGFTTTYKEFTDSLGNTRMKQHKSWKVNSKSALALLPLLIAVVGCIASVPAGHTGVLVTFGKVESNILSEGLNLKLPYQQVINMDNRVQKEPFELEAFSSDIQQTNVIGSVNFSVDKTQSQNLYRNVGVTYYNTVIYPRVLEDVKLVFSGYTAEELIGMRTILSTAIQDLLQKDMQEYGIQIINISIENIDFTDIFTDAVEAKQVAQQNKLATQTQQETAIIVAEAEAKKQVINANAAAEQAKIAADAEAYTITVAAEAEAKANQVIAESLTDALLQYTKIQQWNGTVPVVQSGDGMYPIIDVGGLVSSTPADQPVEATE